MWREITESLSQFETAVLNTVDSDGYPFSVRCQPKLIEEQQILHLSLNQALPIQAGVASLACHSHDENLWNLKSMLIRGQIQQVENHWVFLPQKLILGQGMNGAWGEMTGMRHARQTAQRYLTKRNLTRPKIDWDSIQAVWKTIKS